MTRYKEYLRSKGIKLLCDYPIVPTPDDHLIDLYTGVHQKNREIHAVALYPSIRIVTIVDRYGYIRYFSD